MKWVPKNIDRLAEALLEHLYLVFSSIGIALVVSLIVGIWAARRPRTFAAIVIFAGILFAIPSLALFALLIPVMGIGAAPAITGLAAYSLMILIRNIGMGFQAIPRDVIEAANGMGYGTARRIWEIELPLALPFIVGGLRIAMVTLIGIATVAAYINAGGLGVIIFEGIDQRFPEKIIAGGLLTSFLALFADYVFASIERLLRRRGEGAVGMIVLDAFSWIIDNHDAFFRAFNRHMLMCAISLGIAFLIAIPLGFFVARSPRAAFVAVNIAGALRSIPSLAILAATMPFLGIGLLPSVTALVVLAVPPLLLNTIIGIREIDPAVIDAANGMGMGRREMLWQIEAPLAVPAILAGVRTSAIQVIGGAALASFIGGGGLGDYINAGIAMMDMARLLVGALPIALLAIFAELGFGWLERAFTQRR